VVGSVVSSSSGFDVFFTPGVRLKISPQSRVSLYGAVGGGLASFTNTQSTIAPAVSITTGRVTTGALDFGGGLDLRLTRLLSLRGEARDFLTRRGLGGESGKNHGIYQVGIAFHF
jgi:hypothetical protein